MQKRYDIVGTYHCEYNLIYSSLFPLCFPFVGLVGLFDSRSYYRSTLTVVAFKPFRDNTHTVQGTRQFGDSGGI